MFGQTGYLSVHTCLYIVNHEIYTETANCICSDRRGPSQIYAFHTPDKATTSQAPTRHRCVVSPHPPAKTMTYMYASNILYACTLTCLMANRILYIYIYTYVSSPEAQKILCPNRDFSRNINIIYTLGVRCAARSMPFVRPTIRTKFDHIYSAHAFNIYLYTRQLPHICGASPRINQSRAFRAV